MHSLWSRLPLPILLEVFTFLGLEGDYRDLARLRALSRGIQSAMPYLFNNQFSCFTCSYGGDASASFFRRLITAAKCRNNEGLTLRISSKERKYESCLFRGCDFLSITFLKDAFLNLAKIRMDPNAPTSPSHSPFQSFKTERKELYFKNKKHSSIHDMVEGQESIRLWQKLSSDERKVYADLAQHRMECFSKEIQEYSRRNGTHIEMPNKHDPDQDLESLCHGIINAQSGKTLQSLANEAAEKGMFLPVSSSSSTPINLYHHKDFNRFLSIVTIRIPPGELASPSMHRRDGHKFYVRMMSKEAYHAEKLNQRQTSPVLLLPREEDTDHEFCGYVARKPFIDGYDEGDIILHVPVTVTVLNTEVLYWSQSDISRTNVSLISDFLNSYKRRTVVEGVAIADGVVLKSIHDKLMQEIDTLPVVVSGATTLIKKDLVDPNVNPYIKDISQVVPMREVSPIRWKDPLGCHVLYGRQVTQNNQDHVNHRVARNYLRNNSLDHISRNRRNLYYNVLRSVHTRRLQERANENDEANSAMQKDFFGRKYDVSIKCQWLPTYFEIASNGKCTICDYINGLVPRENYSSLYSSFEELFSHSLPLLESAYSFGRQIRSNLHGNKENETSFRCGLYDNFNDEHWSLKGQKLQIITKIVDYELNTNETYQTEWDLDGLPHEEIVATSVYILHNDDNTGDRKFLFKRNFHKNEEKFIKAQTKKGRVTMNPEAYSIVKGGFLPLGQVETRSNRIIAFPNIHIHKLSTGEVSSSTIPYDNKKDDSMTNDMEGVQKMRMIIFSLVNPEKRLISTREVPPQQLDDGCLTSNEALTHRQKIMDKRERIRKDLASDSIV